MIALARFTNIRIRLTHLQGVVWMRRGSFSRGTFFSPKKKTFYGVYVQREDSVLFKILFSHQREILHSLPWEIKTHSIKENKFSFSVFFFLFHVERYIAPKDRKVCFTWNKGSFHLCCKILWLHKCSLSDKAKVKVEKTVATSNIPWTCTKDRFNVKLFCTGQWGLSTPRY